MCGLVGTVFRANQCRENPILPKDFRLIISKFGQGQFDSADLLEAAWAYKSDCNFIRYYRDPNERKEIGFICSELEDIITHVDAKKKSTDKQQNPEVYKQLNIQINQIRDAHWFLDNEVAQLFASINDLSSGKSSELSDNSIRLFKAIVLVINAIDNRLEVRGRDSFGLSLLFSSYHFDRSLVLENRDDSSSVGIRFEVQNGLPTIIFVLKTSNQIGGLGDNAHIIRQLLKESNCFKKIVESDRIEFASIVAHTRWASVGEINLSNTLPVAVDSHSCAGQQSTIVSALNGDISNFSELLHSALALKKQGIVKSKCTSDGIAIPAFLSSFSSFSFEQLNQMPSKLSGSFVATVQHADAPTAIGIVKRGVQGLYMGFNFDTAMFASDVYGLVEACQHYVQINADNVLVLDGKHEHSLEQINVNIFDCKTQSYKAIDFSDLSKTEITTRDISKRGFGFFLEKEIYETAEIVEKTLDSYVRNANTNFDTDFISPIMIDETQVPSFITDALTNGIIKKIVITGMGTCYTAAVAISLFMRAKLKSIRPDMVVEPHVASEGSGFYIEPNMQDTLVIVIAQSGTTVDTNVYVKMAKERGAFCLALANKREGDVTFLVDGTLYIGDGRDIEIAVPSTKTYTAHVITGYILTLFFADKLCQTKENRLSLFKDTISLRQLPQIISQSLSAAKKPEFYERISSDVCQSHSWFVIRDESANAVCAEEIRIKFSENCYVSVANLFVDDFIDANLSKSFITYISQDRSDKLIKRLENISSNGNNVALIWAGLPDKELISKIRLINGVSMLQTPATDPYFSFLPTIIAGQFMSLELALILDNRKKIFAELLQSIDDKAKFACHLKKFKQQVVTGLFNQGFEAKFLKLLDESANDYLLSKPQNSLFARSNLQNHLEALFLWSQRTIDTVKHQAKTITVGALRDYSAPQALSVRVETPIYESKDPSVMYQFLDEISSGFPRLNFDEVTRYSEVLVSCGGLDEAFGYNLLNIVNETSKKVGSNIYFRLAQPYDFQFVGNDPNKLWLNLIHENSISSLDDDQPDSIANHINIYLDDLADNPSLLGYFNLQKSISLEVQHALLSTIAGVQISQGLISYLKTINVANSENLSRLQHEMTDALVKLSINVNFLKKSDEFQSQLSYAVKMFLSRKNLKCLGSGANYNAAKSVSKSIIKSIKRACAHDVLENHKHIDMSAESAVLTLIANIWKPGYQQDAYSEIEKMLAHNALPIVLTNLGDMRFDAQHFSTFDQNGQKSFFQVPVIKIPAISDLFSFPLHKLVLTSFVNELKIVSERNVDDPEFGALYSNQNLKLDLDVR